MPREAVARNGPMVTAGGLLFIGATRDQRFRAFDSRTGKELWSTRFDYNVTAVPMTYMGRSGRQYVAVLTGSGLLSGGLMDQAGIKPNRGYNALYVYALP